LPRLGRHDALGIRRATFEAVISLEFEPGPRTSCLPEVFRKTSGHSEPFTFAFLGASTPWVYALAVALAEKGHATAAIALYDWGDIRHPRPSWPAGERPLRLRCERWALPPGCVGTLASFFAPVLRAKLERTLARLEKHCGAPRRKAAWIIVPYPWFAEALRGLPYERVIYFNLDEYRLYHPARAGKIDQQEAEMVRRSSLTLCLSQQQVSTLQARHSEKAVVIRHFPLGVVDRYLNPMPQRVPTWKTVGYVGNLMDRVDWRLIAKVASALPEINFVLLGSLEVPCGGGRRSDWKRERAAALGLPNVRRVGPVSQEAVRDHYWDFDVCWIPYATDHAFNRAACPTKIMDGLASGRPVVSTDIPECRSYSNWITIVQNADEAISAVRRLLGRPPNGEKARRQVNFARDHLWSRRAETLLEWLANASERFLLSSPG
jgi:teichuronic acid biosynthesis glycosyltransferase TuaH